MKVYNMPIKTLAWSNKQGNIEPIKFEFNAKTFKIVEILYSTKTNLAGNPQIVFGCIVGLDNNKYECELRYEISTSRWLLFKI